MDRDFFQIASNDNAALKPILDYAANVTTKGENMPLIMMAVVTVVTSGNGNGCDNDDANANANVK